VIFKLFYRAILRLHIVRPSVRL